MGFRTGNYARVWSVERKSPTLTKLRISISRKSTTGGYEDDFSGFVSVIGSAAAANAEKLKSGDRIRLGDVDVTNVYDKEKQREFITFKVFSFEMVDSSNSSNSRNATVPAANRIESDIDDDLPF